MTNRKLWFVARAMTVGLLAATGCGGPGMDGEPAGAVSQAVNTGPLVARPASVDFGTVATGALSRQIVTLMDTGASTVDITSVTLATAFPPDPCRAVLIQPCIRPGDSTTLTLECAPSTAGSFGGSVAINYRSGRDSFVLSVPYAGQAR